MIQPIGYVKLHRELASKPIWLKSTAEQKVILVTLLMMANFKSNQWEWSGEKFEVLPGQFVTSLDSIAKECGTGISIQNVRTALARFEKLDFLTNESTKNGRLITIANWSLYQCIDDESNIVNNKDLTKTSQRPNKDLTPKEERKKEILKEDINIVVDRIRKQLPKDMTKISKSKSKIVSLLKKHSEEDLINSIKCYEADVLKQRTNGFKTLNYCNETTFWNGRYLDFINNAKTEKAEPVVLNFIQNVRVSE